MSLIVSCHVCIATETQFCQENFRFLKGTLSLLLFFFRTNYNQVVKK